MRLFSATIIVIGLSVLPAVADNLSRLEAATELGGQQLSTFLLSKAPELKPNLPNWDWDDAYRTAATCFLERLETEHGATGVEQYLTAVEGYAATPITSLAQTETQPPEMMTPTAQLAMADCGVAHQVMKRMTDSGLMGALMNADMMNKLGG